MNVQPVIWKAFDYSLRCLVTHWYGLYKFRKYVSYEQYILVPIIIFGHVYNGDWYKIHWFFRAEHREQWGYRKTSITFYCSAYFARSNVYARIFNTYLYIFVHICTYLYIYVHIYIYLYVFVHIYTYLYIFIHIYTYLYVFVHICTYLYVFVRICTYLYIFIHICTYLYIFVFVHICTYLYVFVHICTYLYTFVHICPHLPSKNDPLKTHMSSRYRKVLHYGSY